MAARRVASTLWAIVAALHVAAALKRPRGHFRVREWERGGYRRVQEVQERVEEALLFYDHGFGIGGGGRDRRRRGKSPELPEEGELMPEVPPPPPKKGRSWQSQTQEEKIAHLLENAEMQHA
ncbi:hypothetical protein R1flu_008467 [Riccia fluitans]|uniref:Uncharacterized protein n=1 Tax=Riccia fluitans TaxID=41844 RepID=A0ABD1YBU4_9MARC